MQKHTKTIGFIGIGLMGTPMVKRLLAAGFSVVIWNRTPEKCRALQASGATIAPSAQELVAAVDIVMLCLSNTAVVDTVIFGEKGIASALQPEQVVVDFSSIDPEKTKEISAALMQANGTEWIDAPVSGGTKGAETGALIIMAGGDATVLSKVKPFLDPLARSVTHMGPSGAGQMAKICNQMIVASNAMVIAEVVALARRADVDVSKLPQALAGGFADSIPLQVLVPQMADHDFTLKWKVATLLKDLNGAAQMADLQGAATPVTNAARLALEKHDAAGNSDRDFSSIIELYEAAQNEAD
ncbi:MAG: NAD(P)-dependent oxidoreductase [Kordiimonadaceae bacterium]|nr:NAD(P)-dependent oxidoreductase [Kordiimonadaceae bacterium]